MRASVIRPLRERVPSSAERGAVLMEYALVFPLFFFLVLAILDIGHYQYVVNQLHYSAFWALDKALKIPNVDIDYRGLNDNSRNYVLYRVSRKLVQNAGLPLSNVVSDISQPSMAQLIPLTQLDNGVIPTGSNPPASDTSGIALLRPGECVTGDIENTGTPVSFCNRRTLHLANDDPAPPQSPQVLMRGHPVQIVMFAKVKLLNPFFREAVAMGTAAGYREEIPRGPFSDAIMAEYAPGIEAPAAEELPPTTFPSRPGPPAYTAAGSACWRVAFQTSLTTGITNCPGTIGCAAPCGGAHAY